MQTMKSLANLRDDQEESTLAETKKRKKMNLHPHKIEIDRNWLDLPPDVLFIIFKKLGPFDIVYRAQSVCSAWRNLSKQPCLFRFLNFWPSAAYFRIPDIYIIEIGKQILDRSCGQLVALSVSLGTQELMYYVLDKPNSLKVLELVDVSTLGLINAITKVPYLEKLLLSLYSGLTYHSPSPEKVIAEIGRSCSQLKHFSWCSEESSYYFLYDEDAGENGESEDKEILAIAESMPQLRELRLNWNVVTNKGMQAILHGCPYLEYLNLENCYYTPDLSQETLNRCQESIKTLKLPVHRVYYDEYGYAFRTNKCLVWPVIF